MVWVSYRWRSIKSLIAKSRSRKFSPIALTTVFCSKSLLEAEVTGGLEHPGIVPIYGLGKSSTGHPYYAMRLIRGSNFQSHIRRFHQRVADGEVSFDGQLLRKLLRRFIDVCEAIDYAHSRGVLHRDIKPVNVMLGRSVKRWSWIGAWPKLWDFLQAAPKKITMLAWQRTSMSHR